MIYGKTQSKYEEGPLAYPSGWESGNRLEHINKRTLDENMGELVDFYRLRGRKAVERSREVGIGTLRDEFMKSHPETTSQEFAKLLGEFNIYYDSVLQKYRKEFSTQEEFDAFCLNMKVNSRIRDSIMVYIKPHNLKLPEEQRKYWNENALKDFAATAVSSNYENIEAQGDYEIMFFLGQTPTETSVRVKTFGEKSIGYEVPENGIFRYGEYEYVIGQNNGKTTLSIKHLMKPRSVTTSLPSHLEQVDELKKWILDEESDDWTKVPAAIPSKVEVVRS